MKLYKGNIIKQGTTSPYSLYNESIASFTTGDLYDHHDASGFINLYGLSTKVRAMKKAEIEKKSEPELIQFSHKNLGRQPRQGFPRRAVNICLPEVSTKDREHFPAPGLLSMDARYMPLLSVRSVNYFASFYNSSWLTPSSTIWPPGKSAPPQPSTRFCTCRIEFTINAHYAV